MPNPKKPARAKAGRRAAPRPPPRVWTEEEEIEAFMVIGGYTREMAIEAIEHVKRGGGEYIDKDGRVSRP